MPRSPTNRNRGSARPEGLHEAFSMVVSFVGRSAFTAEDLRGVLTTLEDYRLTPQRKIWLTVGDQVKPFTASGELSEIPAELVRSMHASSLDAVSRVTLAGQLSLPFGQPCVEMQVEQTACGDSLAFMFEQGLFMAGPGGPYVAERMEALYEFGRSVFQRADFLCGLIAVEDWVPPIVTTWRPRPPSDWAFWHGSVISELPATVVDLCRRSALEARQLERGALFWKWSEFGEHVTGGRLEVQAILAQELAAALDRFRPKRWANGPVDL